MPTDVPESSPEFVTAVARGLDVLGCFDAEHRRMTLSNVAELTGLTRGTARRFLLTLQSLGYLDSDGKMFWMTPRIMTLAHGFISSLGLDHAVKDIIQRHARDMGESVSIAVLDDGQITYVARADAPRRFASATALNVGSQLPAHCASMGRVLLAALSDDDLDEWLARHPLKPLTERTITDPAKWREAINKVRHDGYAIIDGEMEIGLRSMAVPIVGRSGKTLAALNVATLTGRTSMGDLVERFLPILRAASREAAAMMDLK